MFLFVLEIIYETNCCIVIKLKTVCLSCVKDCLIFELLKKNKIYTLTEVRSASVPVLLYTGLVWLKETEKL